jgi:hypothetical protein
VSGEQPAVSDATEALRARDATERIVPADTPLSRFLAEGGLTGAAVVRDAMRTQQPTVLPERPPTREEAMAEQADHNQRELWRLGQQRARAEAIQQVAIAAILITLWVTGTLCAGGVVWRLYTW